MSHTPLLGKWKAARRKALLSMDPKEIALYAYSYNIQTAGDPVGSPEVYWCAIHKARTGATDLPLDERMKSKKWLLRRGYQSLDDGELDE